MRTYTVTYAMPGYLPDGCEPACFPSYRKARAYVTAHCTPLTVRGIKMTREQPTSTHGYHTHCDACRCNLVWVDTTHGTPPGPDLCGQTCYDDWWDGQTPNCTPPA